MRYRPSQTAGAKLFIMEKPKKNTVYTRTVTVCNNKDIADFLDRLSTSLAGEAEEYFGRLKKKQLRITIKINIDE